MNTHPIDGHEYRVFGRMPVKEQFHVARKIAPVLEGLGDVSALVEKGNKLTTAEAFALVGPLSQAVAKLPDDHCDFVVEKCLALVQRKVSDTVWGPVWNRQAQAMMYDDISLPTMLRLVGIVLQEQLMSFSSGPS